MKIDSKIVVTGYGFVTPLGNNKKIFLEKYEKQLTSIHEDSNLKSLNIGIDRASKIDIDSSSFINKKSLKYISRPAQAAQLAVRDALVSAGLLELEQSDGHLEPGFRFRYDPFEVGIYVSVGMISADISIVVPSTKAALRATRNATLGGEVNDNNYYYDFDIKKYGEEGINRSNPLLVLHSLTNLGLSNIAINYQIKGSNVAFNSFNSGSGAALESAIIDLLEGKINYALVGGHDDWINFFGVTTAAKLRYPDRSFQKFIPAEGSVFLLLERSEHAIERQMNNMIDKIELLETNAISISTRAHNAQMEIDFTAVPTLADLKKLYSPFVKYECSPLTVVTSYDLNVGKQNIEEQNIEEQAIKEIFLDDFTNLNLNHLQGNLGAAQLFWQILLPLFLMKTESKTLISVLGPLRTQYALLCNYQSNVNPV
ncbi:MAG: hypothetical protein HQK53_09990 [Oligoflexia bacterium]|nr:hypothetical protein [Oligoflexia bacterium]